MPVPPTPPAVSIGAVRYAFQRLHCPARAAAAVVSVVERHDAAAPLRFVRWCSLRGLDACDEACLRVGPYRVRR